MAFLQGLASGQQIAQGWLDTYEKSRKGKEAADLKTKREGILTAQPEYSQDYTADQREQFGYMAAARDQEGRPFYNVQTDSSGNYSVTPNFPTGQTPQVGLTGLADGLQDGGNAAEQLNFRAQQRAAQSAPQPIPLSRERVASFLGGRVEGDLTPERMETMRSRALANTIADPMERQRSLVQLDENERAARRARQVEELTGLQISGAKTTAQRESEAAAREEANRTAILRVGEQLQAGGNIDIPTLYKFAGEAGADPAVLVKTAADFLNITEKSAEATTKKLLRDIDAASVDPTKFNKLLKNSFDPDPNDNLSPELRPAAGGGFQVFYGDKPMTQVFKDTKDMPALSQMASFYRDRLSGNPLATAVQIEALNAKRAAIEASRASTAKDRALGGLYAQGGAGKPSATESLVNQAKRLVEDGTYKDTATAIEALKRGSARDADRDAWLKSEQKLIEADTPPEAIEAQRTAFFVRRGYAPAAARQVLQAGVNPATGKTLTRADVDAYNATYPQTPVDPGSLPWLPSPEREARRQGLISQIPK
jgi:Arc/MetJ-type ribon-helix-helix transcriptional regulator